MTYWGGRTLRLKANVRNITCRNNQIGITTKYFIINGPLEFLTHANDICIYREKKQGNEMNKDRGGCQWRRTSHLPRTLNSRLTKGPVESFTNLIQLGEPNMSRCPKATVKIVASSSIDRLRLSSFSFSYTFLQYTFITMNHCMNNLNKL